MPRSHPDPSSADHTPVTRPCGRADLDLSVVAPAHNEEENIDRLVEEVHAACTAASLPGGWEFLVVNDGSTDSTESRLRALMSTRPWLRCIRMTHTPPGRGNGQSAAFHAGFRAARGRLIAVLDADLQNDPGEIPPMIELLRSRRADMIQGDRSHARKDNAVRRFGSAIGRWFRRIILGDTIRDTGCSLRVMKREIALRLPLEFAGMHRFIPVSARRMGYTVIEMPVRHRPRTAGTTKYGLGITKRAIPGLVDCFAVRWMSRRRRPVTAEEATSAEANTQSTPAQPTADSRGVQPQAVTS